MEHFQAVEAVLNAIFIHIAARTGCQPQHAVRVSEDICHTLKCCRDACGCFMPKSRRPRARDKGCCMQGGFAGLMLRLKADGHDKLDLYGPPGLL